MTPEQLDKFNELYEWMLQKKEQQIAFPIDNASQLILNIPKNGGLGATALTQSYSVSGGGGGTITGPKAYTDTVILRMDGVNYEIPYVATP